jgi:ABC-type Fe3+-citrate transport system substrate-binding protein
MVGAQFHEIFESHVKKSLKNFKSEVFFEHRRQDYQFSISSGEAIVNDYNVEDDGGKGVVMFKAGYVITSYQKEIEKGTLEFGVRVNLMLGLC